MNILIAEDDRITRRSLQKHLESWGHSVNTVENGLQAWKVFRSEPVDFVVTDWEMPELNGLGLIERIRSTTEKGYVYIIMLTSHSEKGDLLEGMEAGADDFLVKPFDKDELRVRLNAGERVIRLERTLESINRDLEAKVVQRSEELLRSRDAIIFGLAKLTEYRDKDTGMHIERICTYTKILASELANTKQEINEDWIKTISSTAALHDIGKVGTPDAVLLKEGKLTDEEREIIKKHPCVGGDTLLAIKEKWGETRFLKAATEIALCHHEKWDGTGYPYGLSKEEIPLSARIVALTDVYDALSCKRVYKTAMPHEKVVGILQDDAGTHFDPDVVDAFLRVESEFRRIAAEMQ